MRTLLSQDRVDNETGLMLTAGRTTYTARYIIFDVSGGF